MLAGNPRQTNLIFRLLVAGIFLVLFYLTLTLGSLLPNPLSVLMELFSFARDGLLFLDARASLFRWLVGFFLGSIAGLLLATLSELTNRRWLSWIGGGINDVNNLLRAVPVIGLPTVIIFVAGFSEWGKVIIIAWGCTFPVWLSTLKRLRPSEELKDVQSTLQLGLARRIMRIGLPSVVSAAYPGLRISVGVGWICVVAAEWLGVVEGDWLGYGLGRRLWLAQELNNLEMCVAILLVFGLLGLASDSVFRVGATTLFARVFKFDPTRGAT